MSPNGTNRVDRIEQIIERMVKVIGSTSDNLDRLVGICEKFAGNEERFDQRLNAFIEAAEKRFQKLEKAQERTDHNIKLLIKEIHDLLKHLQK